MAIDTDSFDGHAAPPEVVAQILNAGLTGAPVFNALTRRQTDSGSVVFPIGDPSGFDWVSQLGLIPSVDPGDDAAVVAVAKLAGLLLISNESVADSSWPIADEVGRMISEGMAAKADVDLVYGDTGNPAAPPALMDALDTSSGSTLRAAVIAACADIMGNGGTPTNVILSPSLWADEQERRETTQTATAPLFSELGLPGLTVTVAHTLQAPDALVLDRTGAFGIVRNDASIEFSTETAEAWSRDGISLRVKARLAMAVPTPNRHARRVAVGITSA